LQAAQPNTNSQRSGHEVFNIEEKESRIVKMRIASSFGIHMLVL
jgi:hypothetical protein